MRKGRGRVPVTVPGVVAAVTMTVLLGGVTVVAVGSSVGLGISCRQMVLPFSNATYAIEMVKTGRVPGTGRSRGVAYASFARSPFGVAVTAEGRYIYDLRVTFERLRTPKRGNYTAWVTTPEIDQVKRLGVLDEHGSVEGVVDWNKYLVVLTLEPEDESVATSWSGPIVSRGVSRSGFMHTLAGHGPYENEPCARYGFGDAPVRGIGTR